MRPVHIRSARGFSMTEVIVVMAVLGVLAAIAAPNLMDMVKTQRMKTASFDVYSSLNVARSEAIKRSSRVTLTPNSGRWQNGWKIADFNGNLIKEQGGWDDIDITGPTSITFNSTGRTNGIVRLALTSPNVPVYKHRCITLDLSGRAATKEGTC